MRNFFKCVALAALLALPSATNSIFAQDTNSARMSASDDTDRRSAFHPGWLGLLGLGGLIGLVGRDRTARHAQTADRSVGVPRS